MKVNRISVDLKEVTSVRIKHFDSYSLVKQFAFFFLLHLPFICHFLVVAPLRVYGHLLVPAGALVALVVGPEVSIELMVGLETRHFVHDGQIGGVFVESQLTDRFLQVQFSDFERLFLLVLTIDDLKRVRAQDLGCIENLLIFVTIDRS